jgi:membrane-bound lytic murein transglycosylase D
MKTGFLSPLLLGLWLAGCAGTGGLSHRSGQDASQDNVNLRRDRDYSTILMTDLTPKERFDAALRFYEMALDSAAVESNVEAQNLFESAILYLSELSADSLGVTPDEVYSLRKELIQDYAGFLSRLPELPAESTPSAVYMSLSEFLGDSINSWDDLLDVVLSGEDVEVDTTAALLQTYPGVPLIVNSHVEQAVVFFQTRAYKVFSRWLERAGEAIPYFSAVLKEEGMPEEIVYLAMIESGFSNSAYSRAHASGPWQFIASTAKIYGLEVGYYYDERRDPELATRAACRYLKKLYDQFGDWYLAFASYNCGEMRVEKTVKRVGTNDYWQIRELLPKQTREYIPYYLAARLICQDPEKYGFPPILYRTVPETDVVYVDGCVDLKEIARCAETEHELIRSLNPALKRGCTPPGAKNFAVRIPKGAGQNFDEKIAQAPRLQKQERSDWVRHRVRDGETLSTIARRYGVSVQAILSVPANNLRNPNRISVGQYLMIPVRESYYASTAEPEIGRPQPARVTSENGLMRTIYRVKKGDTPAKIAEQFDAKVSDLKTWNHLWGERYIYPGQKLIIWTKTSNGTERNQNLATAENGMSDDAVQGPGLHIVQPGDTLWDIARKYGISVQNLKKWNHINSAYRLKPGSTLKLQP